MRTEPYSAMYRPSSPLSPSISNGRGLLSPSPTRKRANHPKQGSRSFRLDLPSHPGMTLRSHASSPASSVQSPTITLNRGTHLTAMESPRLMREKQKELIARAQLSSKIAASSMSAKPDAPRLDPLGSPKGAMTPLILEGQESVDYFSVVGAGKFSPATSPSPRSSRSSALSGKEETMKKNHQAELYQ